MTEPTRIFIRPPSWETMTEQERFDWSLAFVRAATAAWLAREDPTPEPDPEDG